MFIAEVNLQKLLASNPQTALYQPLPKFPASVRDVSLLVKRNVTFGELSEFVSTQNIELLQNVMFVGVYEGKGIADDERSMTLRFEYRNDLRTLRDDEVEASHGEILSRLKSGFGAKLRT
ncbi:MAG: hypothetical protein H7Z37_13450 [Pyrinomonadaceae bacterium]|nr:hypothetical protein [Pyrinomonadaceae bacterium]